MAFDIAPELADFARTTSPAPYRKARAAAVFGETARELVHLLKYRDRHDCAPVMAQLMERAGLEMIESADVIIPVPLHFSRLLARRYNQSELLSRHISKRTGCASDSSLLKRKRATKPQVSLRGSERRTNVEDAFAVPDHHLSTVRGKRILLVDDVFTTGATVNACTRALLQAGVYRVDVLVFAIAGLGDVGHTTADMQDV
ncbi:MAG: ComF family protein [Pseudomonadota bacterium]